MSMSTKEQKKKAILYVSEELTKALLDSVDAGMDRDDEEEITVCDMFKYGILAFESSHRKAYHESRSSVQTTENVGEENTESSYIRFDDAKKKDYN